ncbi:FAD-dependent oxidoreductase [Candidatus Formimonas warabiya]|uniref:4Fe-4S ferredoxin n=1 Tax=Formimonas warabiya TaxID=1761012 RepID=A0A3G1KYT8_FORW1|nr:FAD-dependent oxidoreductase [Candidatus Formimonas warabiya]ATW27519.1 4Fe-4S ferredoxin [Candidatus Formimonas warabiya]
MKLLNDKGHLTGSVLVAGGGIAGIEASLNLAEMGYQVYLAEKSSAIGGTMPALDKTFPTNDCSMCILSPKLVECGRHLNIEILTNTEISRITGNPGNFTVTVRQKPRYIDPNRCTGCGECAAVCPVETENEFEKGLAKKKAIHKKYAQAFPHAYAIEKDGPPPCKATCPAGVNAQGYVALTALGKFKEAAKIIYDDLLLPSSLGRICPHPCENDCTRAQAEGAVSLAALKRFLADSQPRERIPLPEMKKEKTAVIGSGPAGLSAAFELVKNGYPVTIFEALPVAGGMLAVGIPDYRLPPVILDQEIRYLRDLGVEIKTNSPLGSSFTLEDLKNQGYQAVFLATGAHVNKKLHIPGEEGENVYAGIEFLRKVNLGEKPPLGENVAVIGGGDVAMDAARSALRLGAREVTVYYRRSRAEMPARAEEIEAARAEGIQFKYLVAPTAFIREHHKLKGMNCVEMTLGAQDATGRRQPAPVKDSAHFIPVDTVINAIGQTPDLTFLPRLLKRTGQGTLWADEKTLATSLPGVFAGGEVRTGPGIAIQAVAEGKKAAASIRDFFQGKKSARDDEGREKTVKTVPLPEKITVINRVARKELDPQERVRDFREYVLGLSAEEAQKEAQRCLGCGPCSECMQCVEICQAGCINHLDGVREIDLQVGAIILSPGFREFPAFKLKNLGYRRCENVITSMQYERLLSASGPFGGHLVRPSDHQEPQKIAWIQCAGSRTLKDDQPYCSSVCCMVAIKEALISKEHCDYPLETAIFYMDMRTQGKDFEKYYWRGQDQGIRFVRSRIFTVEEDPASKNVLIRYAAENGTIHEEEFDLVVLSVGLCPSEDSEKLAQTAGFSLNEHGFAQTSGYHPIASTREGVLVAGAFSGPKDIPDTVVQACAAAEEAAAILAPAKNTRVREKTYPPEKNVSGAKPRIGVFVCHCGINISKVVDVKKVVETARALPHVVYAEDNLYTCAQDTQMKMKDLIEEHRLNRVVVASCSPRTHEQLFRETLKEAGLNPYLFEMANIRDQCSWVHLHEPEKATEKAMGLVKMAVAKARLLEPIKTRALPVEQKALIIGGGVAGMTAALAIAGQNYPVFLVEQNPVLGGIARHLAFNHAGEPVKEFLADLEKQVAAHPLITRYLSTTIQEIKGYVGNFQTTLVRENRTHTIHHGVVIVATGARESRPGEYFYGQDHRVKTHLALGNLLLEEPEKIKEMDAIVLITCVGSRNTTHLYCSKVCCTQTVQLAKRIKEIHAQTPVYVLYRDMRTYGFQEQAYLQARQKGVIFIRYDLNHPPQMREEKDHLVITCTDHVLGEEMEIPASLVSLAPAIEPVDNSYLSKALKVPLNEEGFFLEAHMKLRPVDFSTDGIFLCGLAHGPKPLTESMTQAKAAAARACTVLNKKFLEGEGLSALVNSALCTGCATCASICPAQAVEVDEKEKTARVNAALCKGCGACAASCRSGAIDIQGFRNRQILAMIRQV